MNEAIMNWSSQKLYEGRLQADSSVKAHLLKDLPGVQETDDTSLPLLLIDTAGCDVREKEVEDEVSKGNEGEADIVAAHVMALITAGLQPSDIAVIAPYNLQVCLFFLPSVELQACVSQRCRKLFRPKKTMLCAKCLLLLKAHQ